MLRVRWLGRVPYDEALVLQTQMHDAIPDGDGYLLLLEHEPVYTLGLRNCEGDLRLPVGELGAPIVRAGRGGGITFHGPGQLVGYPLLPVTWAPDAIPGHVGRIEQVVIDALRSLGVRHVGRRDGFPGVWTNPASGRGRKICSVGVRVSKGRSMHGFALNVTTDMDWFSKIVACGIRDRAVPSLEAEGADLAMGDVIEAIIDAAGRHWGAGGVERQDVVTRAPHPSPAPLSLLEGGGHADSHASPFNGCGTHLVNRLARAGVDVAAGIDIHTPKPQWLRVKTHTGAGFRRVDKLVRELDLVTVCQEAGCPNIYECWADGTATFMVNGERCTRRCGFCLVDTRHPAAPDLAEPGRVAAAVARMGLTHAVVTTVARDDLPDDGASTIAATILAVREASPGTTVEVLISDCKGHEKSLGAIFAARPDVLAHNVETVARLQRAVRPNAGYARSLAVLAAAKRSGLTTKSGLLVGLGETTEEIMGALADMRSVGVDIVTIGQYLRPSSQHAPVARWWTPEDFAFIRQYGLAMGFAHVEASPLTRSSYHARRAAVAAGAASERSEASEDAGSAPGGAGGASTTPADVAGSAAVAGTGAVGGA